jgi:hypothetical protein
MDRAGLTRVLSSLLLIGIAAGCATSGVEDGSGPRGSSRTVSWEVTDLGQLVSLDGSRILWSYVVVLRNLTSGPVQLESMTVRSYVPGRDIIGGSSAPAPFRRDLPAAASSGCRSRIISAG